MSDIPEAGQAPDASAPRRTNAEGVLWMLAAVVSLTVMAATLKHVIAGMSAWQAAWLRMAFGLVFMLPWLIRGGLPAIRSPKLPLLVLRGLFGSGSFFCTVYALGELILADAMVLSFTTPFWVISLALLVLGETGGWRRNLATAAGFSGVILVIKPQFGIQEAMLIALLAALLRAFVVVSVKSLAATEPPGRIVFYFLATGFVVLAGPAAYHWMSPGAIQIAWVALAAFAGWIGQEFLSRAYRAGEATVIAPIEFVRIPLSAAIGLALFAEIPDVWTAAGTVIIVAASWYISGSRPRRSMPRDSGGRAKRQKA